MIDKTIQEKIANRQKANRAILDMLKICVEKYPDLRFGQLLYAVGIIVQDVDPFYIESVDLEKCLKEWMKQNN